MSHLDDILADYTDKIFDSFIEENAIPAVDAHFPKLIPDVLKQQIKALMIELVGNDEPTSIGDKWDEFDEAKANRNELKAKLRKKIEDL